MLTIEQNTNMITGRSKLPDNFVRFFLRLGQKCPISAGPGMNKRDRFIAEIRDEASARNLSVRVEYRRGKGGHAMVFVGDRLTTLPSREIDPKTARKIRKQLGLE
jgi:hypothetical protein